MSFDAVLFDFDGVIADSEPVHFAVWNRILAPHGIELGWDIYSRDMVGISDRAMLESIAVQRKPPLDIDLLWTEYPKKKALFRETASADPPIVPSTVQLIRSLTEIPLAVVTSSGRAEVEPILTAAGILDCFRTLVSFEDVKRLKPAPDPYIEAARRLGVSNPLVVEDSDAGEASGRAAGFTVLRLLQPAMLAVEVRRMLAL